VKTTLEIPDAVFRRAKSVAAQRDIPLREFVTEAVKDKLADAGKAADKPGWRLSANCGACARRQP